MKAATKDATIAYLLTSAAEIAIEIANMMTQAAAAAAAGKTPEAIGTAMAVEVQIKSLPALYDAAQALHQAHLYRPQHEGSAETGAGNEP